MLILPGSEDLRPQKAADIILGGYAQNVLIPETSHPSDPPSVPGAASTKRTIDILLQRGLSEAQIVILDGKSHSTYEDAQSFARHFQPSPGIKVIVLTNTCHSRRAKWTFEQVLPEYRTQIRYSAAPDRFDANLWWTTRRGRNDVLTEWAKLLYYMMIYGHGWQWCVILAIVCVTIVAARRYAFQGHAKEREHVGVRAPQ